jgi:hypothetical protein
MNNDISINDEIFLYDSHKRNGGFIGYLKITSKLEENHNHLIVKDTRIHKYISSISNLVWTETAIKIKSIQEVYKQSLTNLEIFCNKTFIRDLRKSISGDLHSFSKSYTEDGELLRNILLKMFPCKIVPILNPNAITISSDSEEDESDSDKESESDKELDSDKELESDKESSSEEDSDKESSSEEDESDKELESELESDKESSSESESEESTIKDSSIPILIIPCTSYTKLDSKTFLKHYLDCSKCNTTNNNPFDFRYLYEKSKNKIKLKYKIVSESKISDLLNAIDNMDRIKKSNMILIYFILDPSSIYNDCIIIK